jgi:hypothetical protein
MMEWKGKGNLGSPTRGGGWGTLYQAGLNNLRTQSHLAPSRPPQD